MPEKSNSICKKRLSYTDYKKQSGFTNKHIQSALKNTSVQPTLVTLSDIKNSIPYDSKVNLFRTNLHLGQRKLCMNEVQFLTRFLKTKNDEAYVIYAGASPSRHTWFLHEIFPKLKFILVDPNTFIMHIKNPKITHLNTHNDSIVYIRKNKKNDTTQYQNFYDSDHIHDAQLDSKVLDFIRTSQYSFFLIEDYYTNDLSKLFSKLDKDIYFWSDIRTGIDSKKPTDIDIIWNLSQQHNWISLLKPKGFMLKYRCPYFQDIRGKTYDDIWKVLDNLDDSISFSKKHGIDFVKNLLEKKVIYYDGTIYIQPWGPITTTEVRLVGNDINKFKEYKCFDAESKFFYYNNVDRTFIRHDNKYVDRTLGFDCCNDCSLEGLIFEEYVKKMNKTTTVKYLSTRLINLLHNDMFTNGHGALFGPYNEKEYEQLYNKQCAI